MTSDRWEVDPGPDKHVWPPRRVRRRSCDCLQRPGDSGVPALEVHLCHEQAVTRTGSACRAHDAAEKHDCEDWAMKRRAFLLQSWDT